MMKNIKKLNEAVLDKISGGVLKPGATDSIEGAVHMFRDNMGLRFDQVKRMIEADYHTNASDFSTTGSEEDLQEYLRLFEEKWNS